MPHSILVRIVVLSLACAAFAPVFAQSPASADTHPVGPGSLNGKWNTFDYKGSKFNSARDRVHRTVDGDWPPLLPEAAELLEQRIRASDEGNPFPTTLHECLPGGVPEMIFGSPYLTQIIESPGQITILHEMFTLFRVIYMDGSHPAYPDPTFMGHSIGYWQGDTLIVDTVGLTDRTSIDEVGMPHSEDLRVIERYRRVDSDTLEIIVTLDDPKTFSRPWDVRVIYKAAPPDTEYIEYVCENNRSAEH